MLVLLKSAFDVIFCSTFPKAYCITISLMCVAAAMTVAGSHRTN